MGNYHTKVMLVTAHIYYWHKITFININNKYK